MVEGEISFGRFRLDLARRELRRDEKLVRLGSRALDILCVLASAGGKLVTKDELMERVWAGVVVEEHNIQVHISALRRALAEDGDGESWIVTVPGRGYRLLPQPGPPAADNAAAEPRALVPEQPSLAVLPFLNLSSDLEQEYFADGMVEEIITALSRIRWLFVIARNSSFTYKGQTADVKRVGRELGVRYVLEGSVRKSGNRVRITCQLIDAGTGAHLWADHFDGPLEDVFDLQDRGRFYRRRRHRARVTRGGNRTFDRSSDDRSHCLRSLPARSCNGLVVGTANPGSSRSAGAGDRARSALWAGSRLGRDVLLPALRRWIGRRPRGGQPQGN